MMQVIDQADFGPRGGSRTITTFAAFLDGLAENGEETPNYRADPGAAFRFIYDFWVKRGEYDRGKPRHSVRQIKDWLRPGRQIRSLETKLAGKTWLPYDDAFILMKLFLSHWTYDRDWNRYSPYDDGDLEPIVAGMLGELLEGEEKALLLPERKRKSLNEDACRSNPMRAAPSEIELTYRAVDCIKEFFSQSDILITISRARTVIGGDPPMAMAEFHDLLEDLHSINRADNRDRTLIWIIDLGLRNDKIAARCALYNVYFLIAQFHAIGLIQRGGRNDLYEWLKKNVCILVGSLTNNEIDRIYDLAQFMLPEPPTDSFWFQSDRLFLESVPGRWLDVQGSEAFGQSQRELWSTPHITAHLKLDDWDLDHPAEIDVQKNLRYLFHGSVISYSREDGMKEIRCIQLPEPGSRWSDAYRLAIQAAFGRLRRPKDKRITSVDPFEALAVLRNQHFAALRLNEFLQLADLLIEQDNHPIDARL